MYMIRDENATRHKGLTPVAVQAFSFSSVCRSVHLIIQGTLMSKFWILLYLSALDEVNHHHICNKYTWHGSNAV